MIYYHVIISILLLTVAIQAVRMKQLKEEHRSQAMNVNDTLRKIGLILIIITPLYGHSQTVVDTDGAYYQIDTWSSKMYITSPMEFGRPVDEPEEDVMFRSREISRETVDAFIDRGDRVCLEKVVYRHSFRRPGEDMRPDITKYYLGDEPIDPSRIKIILR